MSANNSNIRAKENKYVRTDLGTTTSKVRSQQGVPCLAYFAGEPTGSDRRQKEDAETSEMTPLHYPGPSSTAVRTGRIVAVVQNVTGWIILTRQWAAYALHTCSRLWIAILTSSQKRSGMSATLDETTYKTLQQTQILWPLLTINKSTVKAGHTERCPHC